MSKKFVIGALAVLGLLAVSLTVGNAAEPGQEIAPGVRLLARISDPRIKESSGVVASASSSTVSSPAAAVSCGRKPMVALFSSPIWPLSGDVSPRINENNVDLPAPLGPTNPIRLPRLTWSETSSNRVRPLKDLLS